MIDIKEHKLYKSMDLDMVLSSVFKIYLKKFIVLFIASFIASSIIQLSLYQLGFADLYTITDQEELIKAFSYLMGRMGILFGISVIVYGFLNAFLVNYILKSDLDSKVSIGEVLTESFSKHGVHMIFFLALSTIMFVAGAFVGVIVFIIGVFVAMIYLATIIMPGLTILVAEDKNAIEAVGRTFTLTHKDFWSTLGYLVIFILILILISLLLSAVIAIPFVIIFFDTYKETGNIFEALNFQNYDIGMWTIVLNSLVAAITYPLYAILSVVLYIRLRFIEDQKMLN